MTGNNLGFVEWLLITCTTKMAIDNFVPTYYWTLNEDYLNSWDGDDVKLYTSQEILEYYKQNIIR